MRFPIKQVVRRASTYTNGLVIAAAVLLANSLPDPVQAQQTQISYRPAPLVINNDRGGLLSDRIRQLAQLQQQNRSVQIRGNVCFSTCTMFLGLPDACVSPNTTFGFHGPSSYGRALDPATFDAASRQIASYYPPALREWYMNTARYSLRNLHRVSGANIVALGVRAC